MNDRPSYVVDTSVLSKVFLLDEEFVSETRLLFEAHNRGDIRLVIPVIAYYECGSSILKASRTGRLNESAAETALSALGYLGLNVVGTEEDTPDIIRRAYPVARELARSIYDATFLVVSQALDAPFITADRPLHDAAQSKFEVVWLPSVTVP